MSKQRHRSLTLFLTAIKHLVFTGKLCKLMPNGLHDPDRLDLIYQMRDAVAKYKRCLFADYTCHS